MDGSTIVASSMDTGVCDAERAVVGDFADVRDSSPSSNFRSLKAEGEVVDKKCEGDALVEEEEEEEVVEEEK